MSTLSEDAQDVRKRELVERVAQGMADRIGHGMREKCIAAATVAVEVMGNGIAEKPAAHMVPEWQPIETAPGFDPDGDTFLMFEPHRMGGFCFVGVRDRNGDFINNLDFKIQEPTHWMPLPAAPAPKESAASWGSAIMQEIKVLREKAEAFDRLDEMTPHEVAEIAMIACNDFSGDLLEAIRESKP